MSDIVALLEAIESSEEPLASKPPRRGRQPKSAVKKEPATRKKLNTPASSKKGKRKLSVHFTAVLVDQFFLFLRCKICFAVADQVNDQALQGEEFLQGEITLTSDGRCVLVETYACFFLTSRPLRLGRIVCWVSMLEKISTLRCCSRISKTLCQTRTVQWSQRCAIDPKNERSFAHQATLLPVCSESHRPPSRVPRVDLSKNCREPSPPTLLLHAHCCRSSETCA